MPKKTRTKRPKSQSEALPERSPRPLQFSKSSDPSFEHLEDVTPIVEFLEMFRELSDPRAQLPQKLISIRIPVPLLAAFQFKCRHAGIPYQTMIKRLMKDWLSRHTLPGEGDSQQR